MQSWLDFRLATHLLWKVGLRISSSSQMSQGKKRAGGCPRLKRNYKAMRETSLDSELKKKIKGILRAIGKLRDSQFRGDSDMWLYKRRFLLRRYKLNVQG